MSDNQINMRHAFGDGVIHATDAAFGEIDHTIALSEHMGALLMKSEFSDVSLVIEEEEFPVHKVILAARSEYFRALFYGGLLESTSKKVHIEETNKKAFRLLLRYVYTGKMTLDSHKDDLVLDVLALANKYGFISLQNSIADYLKTILNCKNLCNILNISMLFFLKDITEYCLIFADRNAFDILNTMGFMLLSQSAVELLISRDSFCAPEISIFTAVKEWINTHPEVETASDLIKFIRLPLIGQPDLLNIVRPSGLVAPDALLDTIDIQCSKKSTDFVYRGFITPDSNIATTQLGTSVIVGENPNSLFCSDPITRESGLDSDRYTRHIIGDTNGIVVKLGNPYIINCVKLYLPDLEPRMYSYYIEISIDNKDYVRVADYSRYLCRSEQNVYFSSRVARFIRVKGTQNTHQSMVFQLNRLEAMFCSNPPTIDPETGLICPADNIASVENNAGVIEGVSRSRNCLLNGMTTDYDWDNGYTCHQLRSGAITIQLGQPYIIGSMRLLLWDCDDRYYSYYIETSVDQQSWEKVVDRSTKQCRSWQLIEFQPKPVVFVRIVGTDNSVNEVFHCVHFECPANPNAPPVGDRSVIDVEELELEGN